MPRQRVQTHPRLAVVAALPGLLFIGLLHHPRADHPLRDLRLFRCRDQGRCSRRGFLWCSSRAFAKSARNSSSDVLVRADVDGPGSEPTNALDHTTCVSRALMPTLAVHPPHVCHRQRDWAVSTGSHTQLDLDISQAPPHPGAPIHLFEYRSRLKTTIQNIECSNACFPLRRAPCSKGRKIQSKLIPAGISAAA